MSGITSFVGLNSGVFEDDVIEQLDNVDLHHGHHSADPPYGEIEVIGAAPSHHVVQRLSELGFRIAATTGAGFIAVRKT